MPSPHRLETVILVPRPNFVHVSHCWHRRYNFEVLKMSLTIHLVVQRIESKTGRSLRFDVQRLLKLLNFG